MRLTEQQDGGQAEEEDVSHVRAFLHSAAEARMEYRRRQSRVDELENRSRRVTGLLGGPGGRGGRGPQALWAALADERERELAAAGAELERYRHVEELIRRLDKPIYRVVLGLRYLQYLNWKQVKQQMEREGYLYEERQIFRLHAEALAAAGQLWRADRSEPAP